MYTILPKLSTISFFFILPFVSKDLSLEDYAIFGIISAYLLVFQFLVIAGQNVVLQNSFFEYKDKFHLVWSRSFGLMTLSGIFSSLLISLLLFFTLRIQLAENLNIVIISLSLFLVLSPMDTIAGTFFVLKERPFVYSFVSLINGVTTVLVFYYVVSVLKLGYLGWVIMWPCGAIVSYIFYLYILYKEHKIYPNFFSKLKFKKTSIKKGLPLIPHQLSLMILSSSDRLLLQYNGVPSKSIGLYSQGYTIGAYGSYFVNGFFQAFAKKLQEAFRGVDLIENRSFLRKAIFISCLAISLLLFVGSLFTKEFFNLFFHKEELKNGYTISYLVLCSYMFWPLYSYFTYPLLIFNKTKEVFYISGFAAVINIVGNLILIPYFGIFSALYMTYFSMIIFGLVGLLNQSNRVFFSKIINIGNFILLITLLNISLAGLSFLFLNFTIDFKIGIVLILIVIFYFLIKKINSQEKVETSIL